MTEVDNAYYLDRTPPLIKMAAFTILSEAEVCKMRAFISLQDSRIQAGEVFFYTPNTMFRDIEGDDRKYESSKKVSTGAAVSNSSMNRRKVETLLADGSSSTTFQSGKKVMWNNPTVSPAQFQLVVVQLP